MRLLFIGGPGCGKGTQAARICKKYAIPSISTGNILREAIAKATPIGQKAKEFVDSGKLVPDDIVIGIVKARLQEKDANPGYILDGFPRTVEQADALRDMLAETKQPLHAAIHLDVPDADLVQRLLKRAQSEGRSDDTEEIIHTRVQNYKEKTHPLLTYYRQEGILHEVNGLGTVEEIAQRLQGILNSTH